MKAFLRNHSLSIVMVALFVACAAGQSFAGWRHYDDEQQQHREATVSYREYLGTGDFWEALSENWESEFLQMGAFLLLSSFLIQRGSSQSKKPDEEEEEQPLTESSPWPARVGGLPLKLYSHSLSITFILLFLAAFSVHAVAGRVLHNQEALAHGEPSITLLQFIASSEFWFQSLQNWQSEFMSVAAVVLLSIVLREKGSPESKPVRAPHAQTGS